MSDESFTFKVSQGKVAGGLIKLPLSYYAYKDGTIVHDGSQTIRGSLRNFKLIKRGDGNYAIKNNLSDDEINRDISSDDIVVKNEDIVSENRSEIMRYLDLANYFKLSQADITNDNGNFALLINKGAEKVGILNFINFNDLGNEILKDSSFTIKREGSGYVGCISDGRGTCKNFTSRQDINLPYQIPIDNIGTGSGKIDPAILSVLISFKDAVVDELRGDLSLKGERGQDGAPGRDGAAGQPGRDGINGRDADPAHVANELVTSKSTELGRAVLDAIGSDNKNLATQVAEKVNLNPQDFVNKVDGEKLIEGITNKLTPAEAKGIAERTVNAITSDATRRNNPDPEAFKKYEKFAEKLAELLVNRSSMNTEGADSLVKKKVSEWGLAKYLLLHSNLSNADSLSLVREKINQEKLVEELLKTAGLNSKNPAKTKIESIANHFLETKKAEIAQAILGEKHQGKGILASDSNLQQGVAAQLRTNPGEAKGPPGDRGPEGPRGQNGTPARAEDVADQLVTAPHLTTLSTAVAEKSELQTKVAEKLSANPGNAKGPKGDRGPAARAEDVAARLVDQEKAQLGRAVLEATDASGKRLSDTVTATLKQDSNFKIAVKGDPGQNGTPARAEDVADQLVTAPHLTTLSTAVAEKSELQTKVAEKLSANPGNAKGPKGDRGPAARAEDVAARLVDQEKAQLGRAVLEATDASGKRLSDTVTATLKQDSNFKIAVKGDPGQDGTPARAEDVAAQLVTEEKKAQLGRAVLEATDTSGKRLSDTVTATLKQDSNFKIAVKGDPGQNGTLARAEDVADQLVTAPHLTTLSTAVAEKSELQTKVAEKLSANPGNAKGPKGDRGPAARAEDVAARLVDQEKAQLGRAVLEATDASGKRLSDTVTATLKQDSNFKIAVKGDPGQDGTPARAEDVAAQLVTEEKKAQLGRAVLEATDTSGKRLSDTVTATLKQDSNFKIAVKGDPGQNGTPARAEDVADQLVTAPHLTTLSTAVAEKSELQTKVAEKLSANPGNAKGPKGDCGAAARAEDVAARLVDQEKAQLGRAVLEATDASGKKLSDTVTATLKQDSNFKIAVKGDTGSAGPQGKPGKNGATGPVGPIGPQGPEGPRGQDGTPARAEDVAARLVDQEKVQLGRAVLEATDASGKKLSDTVTATLKGDSHFKIAVKGDPGQDGAPGRDGAAGQPVRDGPSARAEDVAAQLVTAHLNDLSREVASDSKLQTKVAEELKADPNLKGPKGERGQDGAPGRDGAAGKDGKDGAPGLRGERGEKGETGPEGPVGPIGPQGPQGERGPQGEIGPPGKDGQPGKTGPIGPQGTQGLAGPAGQRGLQGEKGDRGDPGEQGERGEKGAASLANASPANAKQEFTLQKGKELSDDIYEANIILNGKPVATLPKIGYHMLSGELVIHNHITKEEVKVPRDFHYLKVIKSSSNDDYQLTFCNFLGNEFFEHKKYDPQYSNVPDEYQYISLNYIKKEYNPKFCRLLNHQPSFFITEGITNSDSPDYYSADVFELTKSGKGRKMATLIDQFGFFNQEGKFQYRDYHIETEPSSYEISKRYIATDTNNEFYFNDDVILYTTPEL